MSEIFKALANLPPPKANIPMIEIQGKKMEVSLEVFKEVTMHGPENYELVNGKIQMKPDMRTYKYAYLQKADEGYDLLDGDMFWPNGICEGGVKWTR